MQMQNTELQSWMKETETWLAEHHHRLAYPENTEEHVPVASLPLTSRQVSKTLPLQVVIA